MKRLFIISVYKLAYQLNQIRCFLLRPLTLGVNIFLVKEGKVLLVQHTYRRGWFLPGGGVKRGETLEQAARREAQEELGATLGQLTLLGIYSYIGRFKSDHITVFVCESFSLSGKQDYEIAAYDFFPFDALPQETSVGSRERIKEYVRGQAPTATAWEL